MRKIVECVPNFSEGQDKARIDQITQAIAAVPGCELLHVDPGPDTNRTVVTFVGDPDAVVEGAFQGIAMAARLIDMAKHHGTHPRMGATDVCPFVPVQGVTMEECAELARRLGKRVGEELAIPVYLYEAAASSPERTNLAVLRRGEYEGLAKRFPSTTLAPDFGPNEFRPKHGATVIGARPFLIAYNVNLNSASRELANDIAFDLREKGRSKRTGNIHPIYEKGEIVRYAEGAWPCGECEHVATVYADLEPHYLTDHGFSIDALNLDYDRDLSQLIGKSVKKNGLLRQCKAVGWVLEEHDLAQLSVNLVDPDVTPPHLLFETARAAATQRGLRVTGSEMVGLVPLKYLLEAGRYYLAQQGRPIGIPESKVIDIAIRSLGLNELGPFDPHERIIEYRIRPTLPLAGLSVVDFTTTLATESPTPGGGSVAALVGAQGAGLLAMVAALSHPKADMAERARLDEIGQATQALAATFLAGIDRDSQAFDLVMAARRGPAGSAEERTAKVQAIRLATLEAARIPYTIVEAAHECLPHLFHLAEHGLAASISDVGVAAHCLVTAAEGAALNVRINLLDDPADPEAVKLRKMTDVFLGEVRENCGAVAQKVSARLDPGGP